MLHGQDPFSADGILHEEIMDPDDAVSALTGLSVALRASTWYQSAQSLVPIPVETEESMQMKKRRLLGGAILATIALLSRADASPAKPQDAAEPSDPHAVQIDVMAGTRLPILIGAGAHVELPGRVLFAGNLGLMPSPYVDLINEVSTGLDLYGELEAALIEAALESSIVVDLSLGWRPFEDYGFEFRGGYLFAGLGGGLSGAEAIEAVTGTSVDRTGAEVPVAAGVHLLQVQLGWRFVRGEKWVLRTGVGWVHTIGASADVDVRRDAVAQSAEAYLEDLFTSYVYTPEITLMAGYRF